MIEDDTEFFLQVKHVSKVVQIAQQQLTILRDINLSIKGGESIAILGASGSGKTTLLTLLAGLDTPSSGDIIFQHHHLSILNEEQRGKIRGENVGFIFQSFQLLPHLTALENVMLPLEIQYKPITAAKKKATEWLKQVGLEQRLYHYPTELSGGEQQRVAIARAFVNQRKIIFADEMTGNLDRQTGDLVADILFSLNQKHHITLILVTHDERLAARCEQRFILENGILSRC